MRTAAHRMLYPTCRLCNVLYRRKEVSARMNRNVFRAIRNRLRPRYETPAPPVVPAPPVDLTADTVGEIRAPGAVGYTPRQRQIIDFGWELAKRYYPQPDGNPPMVPPLFFLWLGQDGWVGGSQIMIERHDGDTMAVTLKPWDALALAAPYNPN